MESDFAKHFFNFTNCFFGLSTDKTRSLAWEFSVRNKLNVPENWKTDQKAFYFWCIFE